CERMGHEAVHGLRPIDVTRNGGGFSTDPDGNTIEITFTPFGGDPIPLPPFTVTAVSPSTIRFVVPDTRPLLGRLVVGPAHIVVRRGQTILVDALKQAILPPMNDIHALTSQGSEVEVLATMSIKRWLLVPLTFGGFGTTLPPECPATMTPIVAFAVDFSLKKGDGQVIPNASFSSLKSNKLFLGDFVLSGINLYGMKLQGLDLRPTRGHAAALCALNDTLDVILMIPLKNSADGPSSDILPIVQDGSPIVVKLRNVSADAEIAPDLSDLSKDSLKSLCLPPVGSPSGAFALPSPAARESPCAPSP